MNLFERIRSLKGLERPVLLFCCCAVVFTVVGAFLGLPGADGDAAGVYNVRTRLAESLTYTLSRTPGQPFLDYCNFVTGAVGGERGMQAWYILVSAAGVTALYALVRNAGGISPLAAAVTLALHPLFLAHVGGLGDFSVSLSLLVLALWAVLCRRPVASGLLLGLAVGCRLSFCAFVLPLALMAWLEERSLGVRRGAGLKACAKLAGAAFIASSVLYAPLFCFWGRGLLNNLPFQSLSYHVTALGYRLFVGLGIVFWLLALAAILRGFKDRWKENSPRHELSPLEWAAVVAVAIGMLILFRVPTKPGIAVPILLGLIILFQLRMSRTWNYLLLVTSLTVGLVVLSPYDADEGRFGWHVEPGWYLSQAIAARDQRLALPLIRNQLSDLPENSLLVARCSWTQRQAGASTVAAIYDYQGIRGLTAFFFRDLGPGRVVVHFQSPQLAALLMAARSEAAGQRMDVYYDLKVQGLLKRWRGMDLSDWGRAVRLRESAFRDLWQNMGRPSFEVRIDGRS